MNGGLVLDGLEQGSRQRIKVAALLRDTGSEQLTELANLLRVAVVQAGDEDVTDGQSEQGFGGRSARILTSPTSPAQVARVVAAMESSGTSSTVRTTVLMTTEAGSRARTYDPSSITHDNAGDSGGNPEFGLHR
jgi:hypothetical protein